MTNEMKLLMAFIEASGFDVEVNETVTLDGVPLEKPPIAGGWIAVDVDLRDIVHITNYKVTKKNDKAFLTKDEHNSYIKSFLPTDKPKGGINPRITERQNNRDVIVKKLQSEILEALKRAGKEPKRDTITIINHHIIEAARNL